MSTGVSGGVSEPVCLQHFQHRRWVHILEQRQRDVDERSGHSVRGFGAITSIKSAAASHARLRERSYSIVSVELGAGPPS